MIDTFDYKLLGERLLHSVMAIIIAVIIYLAAERIVRKVLDKSKTKMSVRQHQRIRTLQTLILNIFKYIVIVGTVLAVVSTFGVDVSSLLAGFGIATAIFGLAFQDMLKDFIAGFFIITEGQFEVGDNVKIGDFKGAVKAVGLKTTRIVNQRGEELIVSNKELSKVINLHTNKKD